VTDGARKGKSKKPLREEEEEEEAREKGVWRRRRRITIGVNCMYER
jgi:hypothetical protein